MPVAIRAATRIQDMDDANVSLGVGVDEYALCWDNDTAKFVLRAPTDLSGYLLKSGGTMTGALNFNYQGVRKLYTNILTVSSAGGADYTTITAAIAAATALTPSASNRIAIQVLPGSYQEAIWTLPQYVSLLAPSGGVTCVAADGQRGPSFIFAGYQSVENIVFTYSAFTWKLAKITGTEVALVNCQLSSLGQDGGNDCWTLWFSTSSVYDQFTLRSCVIELISSGVATPTTAHAIHCSGGSSGQSMYLYNCSVFARRLAGTGEYAALYHESAIGGSTIANSSFVGTTYSIRHGGTSVSVSNCAISGGILNPVIRGDDALYTNYSNPGTVILSSGGIRPAADSTTALQLQTVAGGNVLNIDTTNARVGIGTNAPSAKLDIQSADDSWVFAAGMTAPTLSDGNNIYFALGKTGTSNNRAMWNYHHVANGSALNYQAFGFYGTNDLLVIRADGKIGISTTSPATRLDIDAGALTMKEMTAPTGVADKAMLYTKDNGSGKTQLCVKLGNDVEIVLATQA